MKIALLFMMSAAAALCQQAQISGLIQDPNGLNVEGAAISMRSEETGGQRATQANQAGFYSVASLKPGSYRIAIRAMGFQTIVQEGVKLEVGANARLDFVMRIGDVRTVVTVSGAPPFVNTEDSAVGTVIDRNLIDKMPLNGRGIQTLIELAPGVNAIPVTDASRGQFSINGQRSDANYFTVDGISANFAAGNTSTLDSGIRGAIRATVGQAGGGMLPANSFLGTFSNLLAPDALQEFKIQTSTYAPEFGHLPGGQIDLVSRSGSNRYSGSLFEYFRNDKTDANDWFNSANRISKPPLHLSNFGANFGGPLTLGRWYDGHDRTFFFLSIDQLLASQPQSMVTSQVPTQTARQSAPAPLAPFLSLFPLPNGAAASAPGFAFYTGVPSRLYSQGSYGLRIDHSLTKNINFFSRINHAPSTRDEPIAGLSPTFEHYGIDTDSLTFGATQVFTPSTVNELRFGVNRQTAMNGSTLNTTAGARNPGNDLIFPPKFSASDSRMTIVVNPASVAYLGLVEKNLSSQLEIADNLSYARGAHRWKFGGDYRAFRTAEVLPRLDAVVTLPAIYNPDGTFVSAASLATADVRPYPKTAYLVPSFSAYAQDTWRISGKLTMTYGVRWEVAPAPRTIEGKTVVAGGLTDWNDLSNTFLIPTGESFYPTTYTNFAPRLGLAWQVFGGPSKPTVLRLGAGRFFSSAQSGFEDSAIDEYVSTRYLNPPLESLFSGTPSSKTVAQNTVAYSAAAHYRLPLTYQWNVTIEQVLGPQTLTIGYVGALGRRLIGDDLPYPAYNLGVFIIPIGNAASSSYHSMQLQFNRRLPGKLQVLASYAWSHSIDNLSNDYGLSSGQVSFAQNPNGDRGSSDFDIRHSLRGAVIAQLPSRRHGSWAAPLGHWSAESIFFARSALPTDILSDAAANLRPNYVYGAPLYLYGSEYPGGKRYNANAFANPVQGQNGNLGRNVLRGFGAWQIDLALHREIRISEGTRLQVRVEAFNALNHPNFANPSDDGTPGLLLLAPGSRFGVATETLANGLGPSLIPGELNPLFQIGGPRVLQFGVRLIH